MRITSGNQILFFKNDTVLRFEAMTGRTLAHFVDGQSLEISETIENIDSQLKGSGFIRIHDRHIVNANCIARISNGTDDFVELCTGEVLPIDGKQKQIIIELISINPEK